MLERWDQICQAWINDTLEQGSDDEVFSSGYLQGHFAVALSQLEAMTEVDFTVLTTQMDASLEQAKSELEPADYLLVTQAWQQLSQRLQAA